MNSFTNNRMKRIRRGPLTFLVYPLLALAPAFFGFKSREVEFRCFPLKRDDCRVEQGRAAAVIVTFKTPPKSVSARFSEKEVVFKKTIGDRMVFSAFIPVDRSQPAGQYLLHTMVEYDSGFETEFLLPVFIEEKIYPVEELTLPEDKVLLSPENLKRVLKDNRVLLSAMSELSRTVSWEGNFVAPVPGAVTSGFGKNRIANDIPKSPHNGVDLAAALGEEVLAANDGRVSLVYQGFLTGNSLIIDHGGGLYSIYYHLSEVGVKQGDTVKKGQAVAFAGSTGRVTGPHLHFGVRLNNVYVDPLSLLEASGWLERTAGSLAGHRR